MTLYLKYRPRAFADVVGQDHVVTTMERAIERKQVSHAYLLCGTRGTGKTSVARILAKTILTTGIDDPAVRTAIEKGVEDDAVVDLIEIDAASNRRIDDVRELIEKINFSPIVSKAKVYIIDEVHMLTKEAFNALLKTLEEPPPYAYFILATTELHKVPETIQSRCQRFLFKRVKDEDIIRRLQYIADQEHITVDREALRTIAHHATGSFRDAISLLDQLRSLEKIGLADVTERIGKTAASFTEDIIAAVDSKDPSAIPAIIDAIEQSNTALDQILTDLLEHARTGMREAVTAGKDASVHIRLVDTLLQGLRSLRTCPVPVLVLESVLIELCGVVSPGRMAPKDDGSALKPAKVAKKETEPVAHAAPVQNVRAAAIDVDELTIENVSKHWPAVVEKATPPSVRMSLKNGSVSDVAKDTVTISFPSAFHRDKVAQTQGSRNIEDILQSIFRKPVRIHCILERNATATASGPATDLVEAAGEVFGKM